ncbi:hypothetical protein CBZ_04100 [Cellulomonas biazotea]|uniref:Uncharacterized protein n=1 Tax=Cellulomonas biazotea TaxID=1709 RepID=A0A402DMK1_9CELL|nr:hypothetical protein CBZ_04100 [Cellulomonas biazotea]
MVLLNVLLMWAWPWETFFFSLRRGLRTELRVLGGICFFSRGLQVAGPASRDARTGRCVILAGRSGYLRPAFFLPATVRFGPLRVRALVFVR